MSPFKSSFVCLSLLLPLMVYAVFALSAMLFIFKKQTVRENETDISDTSSTDRPVLRKRSSEEKGPGGGGGGGKQENDEDKDVSSRVALLFIQASISVTKY